MSVALIIFPYFSLMIFLNGYFVGNMVRGLRESRTSDEKLWYTFAFIIGINILIFLNIFLTDCLFETFPEVCKFLGGCSV